MFHNCLSRFLLVIFFMVIMSIGCINADVLTRKEAMRIALEKNPEVIASRKEWEAAQAQLTQTRAFPDPEFELEYEEVPGGLSLGKFGERNIGFTQSIEFPLKWRLNNRAASFRVEAVKFSAFEMKKLEIRTKIKIAYDRVLLGKKILEYTEQNLHLAQNFLEKARIRFEAGDISKLEVLRAEVEAGRAQNKVTVARKEQSISKAELNMLLAREIQTPLEVTDELVFRPLELDLERLKKVALENRPDLRGSEMFLAESQTLRSAALSSILPDLNLGVFRQTVIEPTGREGFWRVSFGLDVPLWAMFRQRGEIAEASAEVGRAKAEKDALYYRSLLEVESSFLDVKAAEEQVLLFREKTLLVAEQAYDMASKSYQEGKATYLELLDVQSVLTETRIEFAEAIFNYWLGLAALEQSISVDIVDL